MLSVITEKETGIEMSTKIYHAYRFNGRLDVLSQVLQDFRKMYIDKMENAHLLELLKTPILDRYEKSKSMSDDLTKAYHVAKTERTKYDHLGIDFVFQIIPHKSKIYLMCFGCAIIQRNFDALVYDINKRHGKTLFEDYSYWDNTDREDDISAAAWRGRGKIWDEIFKDTLIPSQVGFAFDLILEDHIGPVLFSAISDANRRYYKQEKEIMVVAEQKAKDQKEAERVEMAGAFADALENI